MSDCTTYYVNFDKADPGRPHTHVCWGRGDRWRNVTVYLDTMTIEAIEGRIGLKEMKWAIKMAEGVRQNLIEWYDEQLTLRNERQRRKAGAVSYFALEERVAERARQRLHRRAPGPD